MPVPVVPYTPEELVNLSKLIYGEAGGEGKEGMQNAGNVMVNRVIAGRDPGASKNCPDFKGINTIDKMVFQKPGGFDAINHPPFYGPPSPDAHEVAQQMVDGYTLLPGKYALWFERPPGPPGSKCTPFYGVLAGKYRNHCFYNANKGMCPSVRLR